MFRLFVKKKKIYGFIRALCHENVENGMSREKIPLFETSLYDTNTQYNSNNYISWLDIVHFKQLIGMTSIFVFNFVMK